MASSVQPHSVKGTESAQRGRSRLARRLPSRRAIPRTRFGGLRTRTSRPHTHDLLAGPIPAPIDAQPSAISERRGRSAIYNDHSPRCYNERTSPPGLHRPPFSIRPDQKGHDSKYKPPGPVLGTSYISCSLPPRSAPVARYVPDQGEPAPPHAAPPSGVGPTQPRQHL